MNVLPRAAVPSAAHLRREITKGGLSERADVRELTDESTALVLVAADIEQSQRQAQGRGVVGAAEWPANHFAAPLFGRIRFGHFRLLVPQIVPQPAGRGDAAQGTPLEAIERRVAQVPLNVVGSPGRVRGDADGDGVLKPRADDDAQRIRILQLQRTAPPPIIPP
jgi:hypothetical protein